MPPKLLRNCGHIPTIGKNPGGTTESWPGYSSNPNKIASENVSPYYLRVNISRGYRFCLLPTLRNPSICFSGWREKLYTLQSHSPQIAKC